MRTNLFRESLSKRPPLGTWLMSGAPSTAEALGHAGFDFLVLDMEHVPIDIGEAIHIMRAIGNTQAAQIVRIPWNDAVRTKRAMDAGADTIMVPFVQNVEEARRAAEAMRYPPAGTRGVAAMHRASHYSADPEYLKSANEHAYLIVQLETPEAISELAAIAAVPGVDALFVGPGDLSAALGHLGDIAHPNVQYMVEDAAKAAHRASKPIGILAPNPVMAKRFIAYGYDFVAIGSDMAMMMACALDSLTEARTASLSI